MNMLQTIGAGSPDRRSRRERRRAARHDARGAAISVAHDQGIDAALCGDISRSGVRLSLDRSMVVGDAVRISLGPDLKLTGRVAWVDQAECGIEFEQAFDGPAEGSLPAVARDRRRSSLARLRKESRFREGMNVTVVLADCERKAVLRWTEDNFASLTLKA